jgi:hypothetical protein
MAQVFVDAFAGRFGVESTVPPEAGARIASLLRNEIIGPTRENAPLLRQSGAMSMKLVAPLLVLAAACVPGTALAGERMFGFEMEKTFSGQTLDGIYDNGSFFSETYFEDGSIRYHDVDGADSGQWSVEDDTFCTFYESSPGACFFVERDGANCFTFFQALEGEDGSLVPDSAWTSRGWQRGADSTCDTPPGAEV